MSIEQPARRGVLGTWFGTKTIAVAALLAALAPACADEPPPPVATPATEASPPPAKPLPPLPRSSIAAVVLHRGDLNLTDEQIESMEKRDREREEEDRSLRAEDEKRKKAAEESAKNGQNGPSGRAPGGGMRGGGMRGGGGGMMPGGGMRGGGMPPGGHGPGAGAGKPRGESIEDRLDANDTKAYLDIEDILAPAQRDAAREIASDFRAQLYDRREQQRAAAK